MGFFITMILLLLVDTCATAYLIGRYKLVLRELAETQFKGRETGKLTHEQVAELTSMMQSLVGQSDVQG